MDEAVLQGEWYIPEKPAEKFLGILNLEGDSGPELTIQHLATRPHVVSEIPIFLGIGIDERPVTCVDCLMSSYQSSTRGGSQIYKPSRVYLDVHLSERDKIQFAACWFKLTTLHDWIGHWGFSSEGSLSGKRSIIYKPRSPVEATFKGGSLSIHTRAMESQEWNTRGFQAVTNMEIILEEPLTYSIWFRRFFIPLRNFLCLATDRPTYEAEIFFRRPIVASDIDPDRERSFEMIPRRRREPEERRDDLIAHYFHFRCEDIEDRFSEALNRWLTLYAKAEDPLNIFFGLEYDPPTFIEQQFTELVHAAEVLHRRLYPDRNTPTPEHQTRIERILESCPSDDKSWIQQRLRFSHEPSLRKRLEELIDSSSDALLPFISKPSKFAQKVSQTRNYLTHRDSLSKRGSIKLKDLWKYCCVLRLVILNVLLYEISGDLKWAGKALSRGRDYRSQKKRLCLP